MTAVPLASCVSRKNVRLQRPLGTRRVVVDADAELVGVEAGVARLQAEDDVAVVVAQVEGRHLRAVGDAHDEGLLPSVDKELPDLVGHLSLGGVGRKDPLVVFEAQHAGWLQQRPALGHS